MANRTLGTMPLVATSSRTPAEPGNGKKPVGRPPATDSAETRRRILAGARTCFARYGYDKTTNKDIASAAGITAGAIYHYFPSKQSLFVALWREVQAMVFDAFDRVLEGKETLSDKIKAVMDVAAEMHANDRSLAAFTAISPIEIQRHEELRRDLGDDALAVYRYFEDLVATSAGDLAPGVDVESVVNLLVAVTTGFAQFGATSRATRSHGAAIDSFKRLVDGGLFATRPARKNGKSANPRLTTRKA
jgi:AcrR family transcriptional regulator